MLSSMAYTQTDLDNIKAAIATGEQTVEVDGMRVTYRDIDALIAARKEIEAALNLSASTPRMYPRYQAARFDD